MLNWRTESGDASRPDALPRASGGMLVSLSVLSMSCLCGGLTAAVALGGRATPTSASAPWIGAFTGACLLLFVWGLLYARWLHRRIGLSWERALYVAALCHLPLLAGLGLIRTIYTDDLANHVYSASVFGQVVFRPLTLGAMVVAPALLQGATLALHGRRWIAARLDLLAPVGVALALRLWNLDSQLPYLFHNDEHYYTGTAILASLMGDLNPQRFVNPSLLVYLDLALYNLLPAQAESFRIFTEAFGRQVWDPRGDYLITVAHRGLVALSGAGTVAMVYLAARELFGRWAGMGAAWLLAVSFLHVRNSHFATNDVAATFLATASFLFAVRLYHSGRRSDYLWAGLLGGLATSTKYNAGLFALPILVAHLLRTRGTESTKGTKKHEERAATREGRRAKGALRLSPFPGSLLGASSCSSWIRSSFSRSVAPLLLSYGVAGAAFLAGTPYCLLDWGAFVADFRLQLGYGAGTWFGQPDLPSWWMHLAALAHGFGWLPMLLGALGTLLLARRSPDKLLLVAALPLVFFAIMAGQRLYFARFTIPLLPFAAILAGCGLAWVTRGRGDAETRRTQNPEPRTQNSLRTQDPGPRTQHPARSTQHFALALLLALAQPAVYSIQGGLVAGREDTRVLADRWVSASLPPGSLILVDTLSELDRKHGWPGRSDLQVRAFNPLEDPTPWKSEPRRPLHVAITSFGYDGIRRGSGDTAALPPAYQAVEREGRLAAIFGAGPDGRQVPYSQDEIYGPFWRITDRERPGPTVRVYRVDR